MIASNFRLPISILEKSDSSILYELPAGKPNKTQACTTGEDKRERVEQSAFKGNLCWYYTFNFIRRRIGKNPSEDLEGARAIESLCSKRRKAITKLEKNLPPIADELSSTNTKETLRLITLDQIGKFIGSSKPQFVTEMHQGRPALLPLLVEFSKQKGHRNFYDFIYHKKFNEWAEVNEKFLIEIGVDLDKMAKEKGLGPNYKEINWAKAKFKGISITTDLDASLRACTLKVYFLEQLVVSASAASYGLQKSPWNPASGIDSLIKELKKTGPLFIGGYLGRGSYSKAPIKLSEPIGQRSIFGWPVGAERKPYGMMSHAILIVGAKKVKDKAFVFFIDCCDKSDPKAPSLQKIYKISFANLAKYADDLEGSNIPDSNDGYCYYGNFAL